MSFVLARRGRLAASLRRLALVAGSVTDTFTRSDSSSLGTTETGQTWVPYVGATWAIASGAAKSSTNDSAAAVESGMSDVDISLDVLDVTSAKSGGIVFRLIDGNQFVMWKLVEGGSNIIFISKSGASSYTTLATIVSANRIVGTNTLRVVAQGTSLKGYLNGVLQTTISSAQFQAATKHGMTDHVGFPPMDNLTIAQAL